MRIFVAGASGVIGVRLVPLLLEAGHEVAGMTRSVDKAAGITAQGALAVVCDVYDRAGLVDAVTGFAPELVLDQLTDLPDDPARIPETAAANSRMRREGTRNLLDAAQAAGARRFLVQSVAWPLPGDGGAATAEMEQAVLDAGGVVLRYGQFYGPGTYFDGRTPDRPRIHVAEAARRTVTALDAQPGIVTLVEDGD